MAKKNLIVGQSGGPTAVINSSLYGVVSEGLSHPDTIEHVYGMVNGIVGFLNDGVLDFEEPLIRHFSANLRNSISVGSSILVAMILWIPSVNFPATRQALAVLSA